MIRAGDFVSFTSLRFRNSRVNENVTRKSQHERPVGALVNIVTSIHGMVGTRHAQAHAQARLPKPYLREIWRNDVNERLWPFAVWWFSRYIGGETSATRRCLVHTRRQQ